MRQRIAQLYRTSVKRVLSTGELFAIGYGDVGSSIYYALGITAFYALGATPLSLIIAGFVFLCTSLSYAELSSMYPESGGSASFSRHAFNDLLSFIAGWALLLDYVVTISISAFSIPPYLGVLFPILKETSLHLGTASLLIIILLFLNLFGVKKSTQTSVVLTSLSIVTQFAIIIIGFFTVAHLPTVIEHLQLNRPESWSATSENFIRGTAMAMVAYIGIESIAQLGSEARNPEKSLPRAFLLSIVFLIFLYIGLAVVAFSALSPQEIGTTYRQDPIAGVAGAIPVVGPYLVSWVGLFAAILLFVAADAGLLGSSRLSFNMGEYYQLPRFFFKLHSKFRTPYVALIFFALVGVTLILLSMGRLEFLADLYNFGVMIAFFFTNLALLALRIQKPDVKRPFRVPLGIPWKGARLPISAIIGLIASAAVWVLVVFEKPHARWLGFAWMILGTVGFYFYRRKMGISTAASVEIHRVEIPELEEKPPKKILVAFQKPSDVETLIYGLDIAEKHRAHLQAVYVMEVPDTLPLDAKLAKRSAIGRILLDRAEALARDSGYPIDLEILRGRKFVDTLLDTIHEGKIDLAIIGWPGKDLPVPPRKTFQMVEELVRKAPCRVLIRYYYPQVKG